MSLEEIQSTKLTARPYQNEALSSVSSFVKNLLRGVLEKDLNKIFQNAALLNMATGSGKTFTIGKALNNIIKLRNKYNGINSKDEFEKLNIVVLTHRIDLVNQFRDDLVYGRPDKSPILNNDILESLHISTYHSKADKEDNLLDNEEIDLGTGDKKDHIVFSTQQTAGLKDLVNKLDYVDIILIDESHNVKKDSDYFDVVKELSLKTRNGEEALVLPVTATPNNHTRELFGQEIFDYGLEKYLNSEYSPSVEYNLVTNANADKELIERLSAIVEESKYTDDIIIKKELIKEGEELFKEIMSSYVDNEELVDDLFERAGENGELEETVIFCDSIKSADELARIMNNKAGKDGFAMSFHSGNDTNEAISKLRDQDDPCKVILSIGKLNEGIDLPKVKNVVFWRGTDSETIFFQQFGRGLRGDDLVKYFDYVGSIKNFAWINDIFVKYNKLADDMENESEDEDLEGKKRKFSLLGDSIGATQHNIDLVELGLSILDKKNEFNVSREEIIMYFKTIKGSEEESYKYLIGLKYNEISNLSYKGSKVLKIASLSGYENKQGITVETPQGFKKWINFIFGKEDITGEVILDYFKNYEGKNEKDSYNCLIGLSQRKINNLCYKGNKIKKIVTLSGWENKKGVSVTDPGGFRKWINWLFNEEGNKQITKEDVEKYFKNYEGRSEKDSYGYFIGLSKNEINNILYLGKRITEIVNISGWDKPKNLYIQTPGGFREWINWLFKEEGEKKITKEEVRSYFINYKGKTKEESYNYFLLFKNPDIDQFQYKGNGIRAIGKLSGWKKINEFNIQAISGFTEFINWLFDKEDETIEKYFKNYEGRNEDESYEYFMGLKKREVDKIKYRGDSIQRISSLSGWENKEGNKMNMQIFKDWIDWLFGKESITIEEYFKNYEGRNKDESYEYFMGLGKESINKIKYRKESIGTIITLSGWIKPKGTKMNVGLFKEWINWLFDN